MRWIVVLLGITACSPQPAVQAAFVTHDWQLLTMNGQPAAMQATLRVRPNGGITAKMACNSFASALTRFPPGWEFAKIRTTNLPCPDGNAEAAFLQAITQITQSRVEGTSLILTGPGISLQFSRAQP